MNATAIRAEIAELRRQGNELAQSDSRAQQAWAADLFNKAADLEFALTGIRPVAMNAHVEAYREHLEAEARARFFATASPRMAAAHRDAELRTGGRIVYSTPL